MPVYLGTNSQTAALGGVRFLHAGADERWSWRLRFFLETIETDYVLLLLEDFFLDQTVSSSQFREQLNLLRVLDGTSMRLFPNPPADYIEQGIGVLHSRAAFRVSLQAAIWNRARLLELLVDDESPWDFETSGSVRSQRHATGYFCSGKPVIHYQHVVERGEWFRFSAQQYSAQGIGCDFAARPVMGRLKSWRKKQFNRLRKWGNRARSHWLVAFHRESSGIAARHCSDLRVAFLTNLIPPYHKPIYKLLGQCCKAFRLFISTPMEANRPWLPEWDGLDVVVQKGLTLRSTWKHPQGFDEPLAVHFPLDTLSQLARFNPDAVISVEMGFRTLLAILHAKIHRTCRLLIWSEVTDVTEHGRGIARKLLRRFIAKRADGFLTVGRGGAGYIESLGVSEDRIFRIAYSTDLAPFLAIPLERSPEAARRLLFSGQLIQRKGLAPFLETLIRWAIIHPFSEIEFALVGSGPEEARLRAFRLPNNVNLRFSGVRQYDELPACYAEAGIFVLPTLADTWAVVVNEAMASGLPILGSIYSQAVQEMVEDGLNGWTFCPDRQEEIDVALDRALSASHADLEVMRVSARKRAREVTPESTAEICSRALSACSKRSGGW